MMQSSKNTAPASAEVQSLPAKHLTQISEPSAVDLQVATLQDRLEASEDCRKEERFLWFSFSGALLVSLIFVAAGRVAGVLLALIYFALLIVLSRKWGFEAFWEAMFLARKLIKGDGGKGEE